MIWSPSKSWWRPIAGMVMVGLLAACVRSRPATAAPVKTVDDWFPVRVGTQPVQMQLAVYPAEMEHGLMFRKHLDPSHGMLFVYSAPSPMSFWMRNTPLPLDIGFFDRDGVLREIYAMYPFDETPIVSQSKRLQFALEMNQGWFADHHITPGARLDLAAVRAALKARGIDPRTYGLATGTSGGH